MIALIDYKAGNLTSVRKALAALGARVFTPETAVDLAAARGLIVPGVGHFAATAALDAEWMGTIRRLVDEGRPLLGICLGMQWLFEGSEEAPALPGLGLLSGQCYRLGQVRLKANTTRSHVEAPATSSLASAVKIPHVGWNSLQITRRTAIVDDVADGSQVYFTHSYVAPVTADTVACTEHGEPFAAIVERGHIAGVQFHPEKSGDVGLTILKNWLRQVGAP